MVIGWEQGRTRKFPIWEFICNTYLTFNGTAFEEADVMHTDCALD